jgi:uncharacterized protein (DUF983 family)
MATNTTPAGHGSTRSTMTDRLAGPRMFLGILITAAAVWFMIANNSVIRIHLWVTWVSARLWLVLLVTFLAGALVGFLFAKRRRRRD